MLAFSNFSLVGIYDTFSFYSNLNSTLAGGMMAVSNYSTFIIHNPTWIGSINGVAKTNISVIYTFNYNSTSIVENTSMTNCVMTYMNMNYYGIYGMRWSSYYAFN